jgi:transposase
MILKPTPQERAMKMHEVLVRTLAGEFTWTEAADRMGVSPRTMRRWRIRLEHFGEDGLVDRRCRPSPRKVPGKIIRWIVRQYRTRYRGFNVRHFHAVLKREHDFRYSYSFVRQMLQYAGLVQPKKPRGRHRLRRDPRAMFGELLHIDGSRHHWLAHCPQEWGTLISVVDDATKQLLYAQLVEAESTDSIFQALSAVFRQWGLPQALYTDRAGWAAYTPIKGEPPTPRPTQVGRALRRLGVEHILAYSPQARGRSERVNRTLQDRLVKELRVASIRTMERANRYLLESFVPHYNAEFGRAPCDQTSAFISLGSVDLDQILCFEEQRVVQKDNTVGCGAVRLQIPKQPGRATCAGIPVTVRRHLDSTYSVWRGLKCLARHDSRGRLLASNASASTPHSGTEAAA